MIKRKQIIIVLLLLAATNVWAQRDYRKGYIITNQQDTIYGWIDYRGDARNAKICSFKKNETDSATEYTPSDIAAYRFMDSKYYVSRNIGDADAPKQVFLEYVVNGLAKLYYYRDQDNNRNKSNLTKTPPDRYFIEKDGQFLELKIDKKEVRNEGNAYSFYTNDKHQIKTVKSYVGVLKSTLNVWDMNDEIDKAKLEHSSLINIAKNYHQYVCTDGSECIVYEKKKPLIALRIAPAVGVDVLTLKFQEEDHDRYFYFGETVHKFDPSTNYTVGVNLNFSMPRLNEKLYMQLQIMYTKYYFFKSLESQKAATDLHIRSNVLQTGLAIKYEYPKGKLRPTLAAGVISAWMPGATIEENTEKYTEQGVHRYNKTTDFPTKFLMGFGIIPGIHYYLTPKRIIFLQAQFLQSFKGLSLNAPVRQLQSFGLSAGIFF